MSVSTQIVATLQGGPHDGDTLILARPKLTFELIDWQGCYLDGAGLVMYRRVGFWQPGDRDVDYEYVDPDEGATLG